MSEWSWAAVGAAVGAFVTGLFAWITQREKRHGDVEVAVIGEWEKLTAALSARLSAAEKEFAEHRMAVAAQFESLRAQHAAEIDAMRKAHRIEIDEMRRTHRAEMKAMRELNEGLQRQIAQNSQSTAYMIGENPVPKEDGDGG